MTTAVRRPGRALCRDDAADLSSLKAKWDGLGVPLYEVVKEQIKTEVKDFQLIPKDKSSWMNRNSTVPKGGR